jgi:hypothetical protein
VLGVLTACGGGGSAAGKPAAIHTVTTATVPLAVKLRAGVVACRGQIAKSPFIPVTERAAAQADCNGILTGHIGPLKAIILKACLRAVAKVPAHSQAAATLACKKLY